ncbi:MAG: Peptide methionine sulfoxide reductase MsrA [Alphaproteobacteria bacterium MarineAlpha5_Bin12]|nr:peptide-methionine (S)-S-oxide reductase [Pelagibacteraceae bacterium]PPR41390.1 MAG: Peptide methionine sulfoxide reductase MsrA [Alphaproteobacteria bacterium MarineAlpha5_Bin12]|tara:strand:+ start:6490 stop:6945 length:456 start_codon:yes stop_codon:yes gene_type:complete
MKYSIAILAAGCFWGVQDYFSKINGVKSTKVGYSGGNTDNPSYEQVCSGLTGHAECILINFDEKIINYEEILSYFWKCHDPTQLNRQGPDIGTQYRSAIFYCDENQQKIAINSMKNIKQSISNIVTELSEAKTFYDAEEYHQNYITKCKIF